MLSVNRPSIILRSFGGHSEASSVFLVESKAKSPTRQGLRCVQPGTRAVTHKGKKGGTRESLPSAPMKHSKMSASYDHINTPFYQSNGVITQLGRVRLRIVSGEKMRTALETASFAQLNIKKTTQQRSAIHAARKVTLFSPVGTSFRCYVLTPSWTAAQGRVRSTRRKACSQTPGYA